MTRAHTSLVDPATPLCRLAPAKINLALHVTGQRPDGYHLLDSLVVFTEIGDVVSMTPATGLSLDLTGDMARDLRAEPDNLVLRAARLVGEDGAAFTLDKRLPVASGMGGGSSDAAAALHLVAAFRGRALPDVQNLMRIGADLPVCMRAPSPCRMQGLGEQVRELSGIPALWMVLVNPGVGLSTPAVFRALLEKSNPELPETLPQGGETSEFCTWLTLQRNDLEAPACALLPEIETVLNALKGQDDCALARMTGSGATCFGLFPDQASRDRAANAIRGAHPEWFVAQTRSFGS